MKREENIVKGVKGITYFKYLKRKGDREMGRQALSRSHSKEKSKGRTQ